MPLYILSPESENYDLSVLLHLTPDDFDYDVDRWREYMRGRNALVRRLKRSLPYSTLYEIGLEGI